MYRYMFRICMHISIYIYDYASILYTIYFSYNIYIYIYIYYSCIFNDTHIYIYIYIHIRDFTVILYLFFFVIKDILASQLTFPIFPSWFQLNGALCPGQGLAWPAGGTQSVSWCLPWCFRCLPSGSCWRGPSPTTFRSRGEAAIARGDQWKSNRMWPGVQEIWCSTISTRLEKDCHDQK